MTACQTKYWSWPCDRSCGAAYQLPCIQVLGLLGAAMVIACVATLIGCGQVIWNNKMREELLERMEAARTDPADALPPADFQFQALQVQSGRTHLLQFVISPPQGLAF